MELGTGPPEQVRGGQADRQLSPQQQALLEALAMKHNQLAQMYLGGCLVLGDPSNPQYISMAAYCFRELMDHMAKYLDLPVPAEPPGLKNLVDGLTGHWEKVERKIAKDQNPDQQISSFLKQAKKFFDRVRKNTITRSARTAVTLEGIDPSRGAVPEVIQGLRIKEWSTYDGYFNKVLHHSEVDCTEEAFRAHLDLFERFLLDYFRPRTFDDYSAIDAIIAEGEYSA